MSAEDLVIQTLVEDCLDAEDGHVRAVRDAIAYRELAQALFQRYIREVKDHRKTRAQKAHLLGEYRTRREEMARYTAAQVLGVPPK